jgi:hypothetical protein
MVNTGFLDNRSGTAICALMSTRPKQPIDAGHRPTEPAQARFLLPTAQMVIRPSSTAAVMILQTSFGSIRNVSSLSNVTRPDAAPTFASTVLPIAVPDGTVMVRYDILVE